MMDRRSMLAAAAAGSAALATAHAAAQPGGGTAAPELYELRTYQLAGGAMRTRLDAYLEKALLPAARRAGAGPIGVFTAAIGMGNAAIHLLIPHRSAEAFLAFPGKLAADRGYIEAAAPYADATPDSPPYAALEVKLMRAFAQFPRIAAPDAAGKRRIFELRTYHSHSEKAGTTKIGMFEAGGEIEMFHRVGLTPIFFAQDLTGTHLPSLTYLLTFPDMSARDRAWQAFGADPAWQRLIAMPGLAETVSSIDNQILQPTRYSQI